MVIGSWKTIRWRWCITWGIVIGVGLYTGFLLIGVPILILLGG